MPGIFFATSHSIVNVELCVWCIVVRQIIGLSRKYFTTTGFKFVFKISIILRRLYCKYLQIGIIYRRLENGVANCNQFGTCVQNLVNFGPRMAKIWPFFNPIIVNFCGRNISGVKGCCLQKISLLVKGDQCLLMRTLYCRGSLGEFYQTFLRDVSPQGHKQCLYSR